MSTVAAASPIVAAAGGSFLIETRTPAEVFIARRPERRTAPDCRDRAHVCAGRDSAGGGGDRGEEAGRAARADAQGRRTGVYRRRYSRGIRRHGDGQDQLHGDHRSLVGAGQFLDGVRRANRHRHAAAGLVRDGGAEADAICPSWPRRNGSARMGCRRQAPARTP